MKKLIFLMSLFTGSSFAGIHCTESISAAILHKNGNVYFTSSKTCKSWCQIRWTSETDKDRAFSMLLAARTAKTPVTFYWGNLNSCTEKNPTYQSPDYIVY
ncbi:hypothetical protein [Vibrio penaeicida]|uniref:hypothetical protein n=1 Tax=Vibrio penaeicida TaxID=104609 RepID=UPI000FBA2432|nr:hypothetical protein [Vibrio penaeicida]RTZ24060.1 hypothetical protein EKN09_05645 [Vibrio penaeicida]